MGIVLVDGGGEGVHVHEQVDARVSEGVHAIAVVSARVDVVDTDRVRAEGLHQVRIEGALSAIEKRVVGSQLIGDAFRLCQSAIPLLLGLNLTFDVELSTTALEELGTLDRDWINRLDGRQQASSCRSDGREAHDK